MKKDRGINELIEKYPNLSQEQIEKLYDSITITGQEQLLLTYLCSIEHSNMLMSIGNIEKKAIKSKFGIETEKYEINLFLKLFLLNSIDIKKNKKLEILGDIKIGDLFQDFADCSVKTNEELVKLIIMFDGQNIKYMEEKFRNDEIYMNFAIKHDRSPNINSFLMTETNLRSNPNVALTYFQKRKVIDGYLFKPSNIYKEFFEQKDGYFPNKTVKNQEQKEWLSSKKFLIGLLKTNVGFVEYIVDGKIPMNLVTENNKKTQKNRI